MFRKSSSFQVPVILTGLFISLCSVACVSKSIEANVPVRAEPTPTGRTPDSAPQPTPGTSDRDGSPSRMAFEIKGASNYFDIKAEAANCEAGSSEGGHPIYDVCRGRATFSFYKKGTDPPYQVIELPDTYFYSDILANT